MSLIRAYIALGSNQGDRLNLMQTALNELVNTELSILQVSPVYENRAIGMENAEDFLNAVIEVDTSLSPIDLLDHCLSVEFKLGRKRSSNWSPRTIDLDLIDYGCKKIKISRLSLPHPRLLERDFVVHPLNLVAPNLVVAGRRVCEIAGSIPSNELNLTSYSLRF